MEIKPHVRILEIPNVDTYRYITNVDISDDGYNVTFLEESWHGNRYVFTGKQWVRKIGKASFPPGTPPDLVKQECQRLLAEIVKRLEEQKID